MEEKKLTYKLIRAAAAGEPQAQEDIVWKGLPLQS